MRGDLIETFKIVGGHVEYGSNFFCQSRSGRHMYLTARSSPSRITVNKLDFFSQRVLKYWNNLPDYIKQSSSVNTFKNNLDGFRAKYFNSNSSPREQFWELSEDIFRRDGVDDISRQNYRNYMVTHPFYARYRRVNIH